MTPKQQIITLEPPWWRCENGCEFRRGENKPKECPVCRSMKIEMVVEIDSTFRQEGKVRE